MALAVVTLVVEDNDTLAAMLVQVLAHEKVLGHVNRAPLNKPRR